ncbi:MFS transporter [Alicyclobacillus acidoterrestris]|uniref:MFS transporter n=1 Tax=Alicyclobacillus acidoterrestris TaxID=1450 RepID=UPI003F52F69B
MVLIARLIQGVSTGIEQPAANAAAMEIARPGRQGLFSGVVNVAFNQGGNLMASLICFLASMAFGTSAMQSWGWRIPFLIGGVAALIVLLMRRSLPETGASVSTNVKLASTAAIWRGI